MNAITSFFSSSIGRKWVVALSGLVLVGFVVGHMVGNLQIFLGRESINRYGAFLQGLGELLWAVRLFLLLMLVVHIVFTIKLRMENRAARPVAYAVTKRVAASPAARWMVWSGLTVLCFLIFHLLHFTAQTIDPSFLHLHDEHGRHDVYQMMINGFLYIPATVFYVIGVGLLGLHLNHGFQSMFQSLGLNSGKLGPIWSRTGQIVTVALVVGYLSIPAAVLAGVVK